MKLLSLEKVPLDISVRVDDAGKVMPLFFWVVIESSGNTDLNKSKVLF